MSEREKVLVAMSGGVDSSLAARLLLDGGSECIGCIMKLWRGEGTAPEGASSGVEDARSVARRLGLPFHVFDFTREFERDVVRPFIDSYERGCTPNPCIDCNRRLKFGYLLRRAEELGCSCVATGHYARIEERDGRYLLKKAVDESKDQTYFLAGLTQEQLARVRFPLGGLYKTRVRELAQQCGFVNAGKRDSQDICFVPDGDYAGFMERYTGKTYPPGDFLDRSGNVVGRHRGAVRYTMGQRRGLDLALGEPVYVCAKNMQANTVTVGPDDALFTRTLWAEDMNWIAFEAPEGPRRFTVKIRHSRREQPATVRALEGGRAVVEFDEPQRAVTPGQAVVLYDGQWVAAGGVIAGTERGEET